MIESQLIDLEPYIRTVTTILMHSLWQGVLIGLLAATALSLLRSSSAKIRYAVSCSAMAAVIVATALTALVQQDTFPHQRMNWPVERAARTMARQLALPLPPTMYLHQTAGGNILRSVGTCL